MFKDMADRDLLELTALCNQICSLTQNHFKAMRLRLPHAGRIDIHTDAAPTC